MPELALAALIGGFFSLLFTVFVLFRLQQHFQSDSYILLQKNLQSVNLYWSENSGEILNLETDSIEADQKLVFTSSLVFGVICIFLSYLGLAFHALVYVSKKKFAVSEFEKKIFASSLCREVLAKHEVENVLNFVR